MIVVGTGVVDMFGGVVIITGWGMFGLQQGQRGRARALMAAATAVTVVTLTTRRRRLTRSS